MGLHVYKESFRHNFVGVRTLFLLHQQFYIYIIFHVSASANASGMQTSSQGVTGAGSQSTGPSANSQGHDAAREG